MFFLPRYLPLGKDSDARLELSSLRHGLDTASPLVVHGLRNGAISEYQGRRFFSLQRDITGLLRELIKNEDNTRWQMKHAKAVKNAIRIGFADLEAMYRTLATRSAIHSMTEKDSMYQPPTRRRTYYEKASFRGSSVVESNRPSYITSSRTISSYDD